MPLQMHLRELRERLIKAFIAQAGGTIVAFTISDILLNILTGPLRAAFTGGTLIGTGPADAFMLEIHLALAGGFLISLPLIVSQLWFFIAPGLHEHEKRFALPFIAISSIFFLCGVLFCFYFVIPAALGFFAAEFVTMDIRPTIRIAEYLSFVVKMLLVFGIVFEMPILSYFLARLKLLSAGWLVAKLRFAVVIIFIAAGVLTPGPDVASQVLLAGPMLLLYALCIAVVKFTRPRSASEAETSAPTPA